MVLRYSKAMRRWGKFKEPRAAVSTWVTDEAAVVHKVGSRLRLRQEQHTDQRLIAELTAVGLQLSPVQHWHNFTIKVL